MKPTTRVKALWAILMLIVVVYQVAGFMRFRHQHGRIFDSTREMFLVFGLIAVSIVGVFMKSRKDRN